ncbi:hypothetical protein L1F30_11920 [Simiduia sp. 21SJ11W-1]|uniref:DUF7010 family protein n=1 Tax=Simiduia sp. 21SJ11W-1 TaxID=2909669 RepID=UPI00209DA7DF|nr:hypothetical protein [Simiduia sp. 21SJ11W-1]UTA46868.1 hypothetical protein L1F30_11920 [Simiduia sp. 21SJ11W-1]
MDIQLAQADMRKAYDEGRPGVLVSGLVWALAAGASLVANPQQVVWLFFICGALIHPLAVLIAKLMGATGSAEKANPLQGLALASTAWLIFSLPLAYGIFMLEPLWFFPALMLIIGGRYLVFATLYGIKSYWVLGLALAGSAYPLAVAGASFTQGAALGAVIEISYALVQWVIGVAAHQKTLAE